MAEQVKHLWSPIDDLPTSWKDLSRPETAALVAAWHGYAGRLKSRESYERFLVQLRRQWAIETGILERLYTLSEGATKTLIEKGFDEALISHGDTDRSPGEVIALISDQHHAIEGLYQFISGNRPLGTSYVKELHQVLTANQPRYDAIDTLGNRVQRDLPRGQWKQWPNNVEGPDGFVFQFCPPEQVDTEMERLLKLHEEHERLGVPPDVEAAWLHHRFTLIHPFADGNGRVARCLATLVLLKAEWFPLVITRDDRTRYIESLRAADRGELGPLVVSFDELQDKTIREALSISGQFETSHVAVKEILSDVESKYARMQSANGEADKRLRALADTLHVIMRDRLAEVGTDVNLAVQRMNSRFSSHVLDGSKHGSDEVEKYHHQIDHNARSHGYFANTLV